MSEISLIFGALLSFLGLGAYAEAEDKHITALIPSFLGLPLLFLGLAGQRAEQTKDAMHAAAGIGLLGFLISLQGLLFPEFFPQTAGGYTEHPRRGMVQAMTTALTGIYVILSFKSFLEARRVRQEAAQ